MKPLLSQEFGEEITFSTAFASRHGIRGGEHGILKTTNVVPDVPGREYAVYLKVEDRGEVNSNTLLVNSSFFEELQFGLGQEWELHPAESYRAITSLTLEPSMEQERLRDDLRRLRRSSFLGRCLLALPGQTLNDLSLRVSDQAYFNVYDIEPQLTDIYQPTVLGIGNETEIKLFIPHRKGGIDMVVIVDASNSMELRDYADRYGKTLKRIEGARLALETLFEGRLASGSRVSHFALVVFGKDSKVVYPANQEEMAELSALDIDAIRKELRNLTRYVNREGTDISSALDTAAELLFRNAREDNEKIIVLLSDGANWVDQKDPGFQVEFKIGKEDPIMFADNLYDEGQIRIHTIAISNEENLRRYVPEHAGKKGWTPDPRTLSEIARRTRAIFFPSPDAEVLNKLFEDLGKGAMFPLS